jgi:hypothetical protein
MKETKFEMTMTIAMNFAVSKEPHSLSRYRSEGANRIRHIKTYMVQQDQPWQ